MRKPPEFVRELIIKLLQHHGSEGIAVTYFDVSGGTWKDYQQGRGLKAHGRYTRRHCRDDQHFGRSDIILAMKELVDEGKVVIETVRNGFQSTRFYILPEFLHHDENREWEPKSVTPAMLAQKIEDEIKIREEDLAELKEFRDAFLEYISKNPEGKMR